ncbi:hypothetical protein PAPYR_6615 [Paratrimastix pyriformis]|uniref:Uncharacterized protein n=1 Tax=Paratrimastix pyriformis TaxID=342808 RepID=A0ABQ8UM04_9EUKA|nr:hypothetical protein PAPYR_6615 [Paratrimastix pyriformis]
MIHSDLNLLSITHTLQARLAAARMLVVEVAARYLKRNMRRVMREAPGGPLVAFEGVKNLWEEALFFSEETDAAAYWAERIDALCSIPPPASTPDAAEEESLRPWRDGHQILRQALGDLLMRVSPLAVPAPPDAAAAAATTTSSLPPLTFGELQDFLPIRAAAMAGFSLSEGPACFHPRPAGPDTPGLLSRYTELSEWLSEASRSDDMDAQSSVRLAGALHLDWMAREMGLPEREALTPTLHFISSIHSPLLFLHPQAVRALASLAPAAALTAQDAAVPPPPCPQPTSPPGLYARGSYDPAEYLVPPCMRELLVVNQAVRAYNFYMDRPTDDAAEDESVDPLAALQILERAERTCNNLLATRPASLRPALQSLLASVLYLWSRCCAPLMLSTDSIPNVVPDIVASEQLLRRALELLPAPSALGPLVLPPPGSSPDAQRIIRAPAVRQRLVHAAMLLQLVHTLVYRDSQENPTEKTLMQEAYRHAAAAMDLLTAVGTHFAAGGMQTGEPSRLQHPPTAFPVHLCALVERWSKAAPSEVPWLCREPDARASLIDELHTLSYYSGWGFGVF